MKRNLDVGDFFSQIAARYDAESRLSRECATAICQSVVAQLQETKSSLLLDIGGGPGYFEALICRLYGDARILNLDISLNMLNTARENLAALGLSDHLELVCADAHQLPLGSVAIPFAFISYTIHLLNAPRFLSEIRRVLIREGRLLVVTFAREDMLTQIYHAYFPGFFDIDSKRFVSQSELVQQLRGSGLDIVKIDKFPYAIPYASVDEVVKLVRTRPFSTFSTKFYSDSELEEAISIFQHRLIERYGDGPLANECQLTLVTSAKA